MKKGLQIQLGTFFKPKLEKAGAYKLTAMTHDHHIDVDGALSRLGGRKQLFLRMLQKLEPECGQAGETIAQHLCDGNREDAKRTAHTVKGTSATIGALSLSKAAAELENAIAEDSLAIDDRLAVFKSELQATLKACDAVLENETATET